MSATALLMKEAGYAVTGSDTVSYGPTGRILREAGISVSTGYTPANIPEGVALFVIGRNAKLAPSENEEVRAAHEMGLPIRSFPEVIGELTKDRPVTTVVGSYGKSTTTALIAHILADTGAGYFIGAEPLSLPAPARLGTGVFVAEGDEYPSGFDDARAKFLHLHPRDVVLTSVVHDHVNVYPTFADYQAPFQTLLASVPDDGIVIACADEPGALALAQASKKPVVSYGLTNGTFQARDISYGEITTFTLTKDGEPIVNLSTTLLGAHNIEDMVGAAAYVLTRALVSPEHLAKTLATFTGVRRRLDRVVTDGPIPVYEGFGSSYEKARAAIAAMTLHFPHHPLVIVFEPHTFGWRNRANIHWYDDVFTGATRVYIAPPETQGATTHEQLRHEDILMQTQQSGIKAHPYNPEHPEDVVQTLRPGEVVLILTSGDLEGSLPALLTNIRTQFS